MSHAVLQRNELVDAKLNLGGQPLDLTDYATTGLRIVAIGPSGAGKTNAGLQIAEQLAEMGWVCVLVDPEREISSMYGEAVASPEELTQRLKDRSDPFVVVAAADATAFIPYGRAIIEAADAWRKPIFVMMDEGQIFSAPRKRKGDIGEACDILNEFVERGRKRGLDLFVTAHRFTASLHRSVFANKNLSFIGCQEDPTAWSSLSATFKGSNIEFSDLASLSPGEFFCISRRGIEKVRMPMARALQKVSRKAKAAKPSLPRTFAQWDRAMRALPTPRLEALAPDIVSLLAAVAGLSYQQIMTGNRALEDELASRG